MPRPGLDVDQVVRLDDCSDIAIDELAAVIVNDPRFDAAHCFERRLQLGRH